AVPIWMLPLAYGGPSCSTKRGLPSLCFISWLYRSFLFLSSSMTGSFLGRPARISNRVLGRCRVQSYWDFVLGTGTTLLKILSSCAHRAQLDGKDRRSGTAGAFGALRLPRRQRPPAVRAAG